MRTRIKVLGAATALCLAGAVIAWGPAMAGGNGGPQTRVGQMRVAPQITVSPVTADRPLNVCVSGLSEGSVALVLVPYKGNPSMYSNLTYCQIADASGGFCFDAPPSWTQLELQPGSYTVRMTWGRNDSSKQHDGPSAQFEVSAN